MKHIYSLLLALATLPQGMSAQGWPANYDGVMLQGFYWDSFDDTQWKNLQDQTKDLAGNFSLVWIPQSGKCLETYQTMGYTPYYYFNQNSSFGTESELRDLISSFKAAGIGTVADVVVNHHNTTGWFTFPAETYNGVTYQLLPTDITANDDGGKTARRQPGRTLRSVPTTTRARTGEACATSTTRARTCRTSSRLMSGTSRMTSDTRASDMIW